MPAIIPAGQPKSKPAVSTAASLQLTTLGPKSIPHSVPKMAIAPKMIPISSCLAQKDNLFLLCLSIKNTKPDAITGIKAAMLRKIYFVSIIFNTPQNKKFRVS